MRSRILSALLAAWLLAIAPAFCAPASNDVITLTNDELVKMGVNLSEFAPGAISNSEKMMVAHQKITDAREIARGHVYKLFIFHIDRDAKKITSESLFLPLPSLEQYAWSADDKSLVCLGGYGTQIIAVDIPSKTIKKVFAYEKGQPGFRATSFVTWLEKGRLYTRGYFYDKEQVSTGNAVVAIDPSKEGLAALEKVLDIDTLERTVIGWAVQVWYATDQAWFVISDPDKTKRLFSFTGDQQKLRPLDSAAYRIDLVAAGQNRAIACMRDSEKVGRTVIHDISTGKQWRLGEPKKVYLYPYMSRDGTTVLVSTIDLAGRKMTTWYAHDTDAWGLHPMPGMVDAFPGVIRFSRKGGFLANFDDKGLHIRPIP